METLQRLLEEYYNYKKRHDKRQSIYANTLPISPEMKNAAEKCCNYIYNHYMQNFSPKQKLNRIIQRKDFLFFQHYVKQIKREKDSTFIKNLNSIEVANQILKDHPEFIPTPKEYTVKNSYELYGDFFRVNGKLCLVTGSGKSRAMRKVPDSEEVFLDFAHFDVESDCLSLQGEPIAYFIHMAAEDEISEEEIVELSAEDFLLYAYGNYGMFSYDGPEEILPVIKLAEEFHIPMLLVPWGETHEDKIQMISNYFERQDMKQVIK